MQKQVKTVKNDAKTAEIQFKNRQDTSEGADFCKHPLNEPLRTRWAPPEGVGRPLVRHR